MLKSQSLNIRIISTVLTLFASGCRIYRSNTDNRVKSDSSEPAEQFVELPENFLSCMQRGDSISNCKIRDDALVLTPEHEGSLKYLIQYRSGCAISMGRFRSTISLTQDQQSTLLAFDQPDWIDAASFSAQSPITLTDARPNATASLTFLALKPCFLNFRYRSVLSDVGKERLLTAGRNLDDAIKNYRSVKRESMLIETMAKQIEILDLDNAKTLFSGFKEELQAMFEKYPKPENWQAIIAAIDEVTALNSVVDPKSKIDEVIAQTMREVATVQSSLVNSITTKAATELVTLQKLLTFSKKSEFSDQRRIAADGETLVTKNNK